MKTCLFNLKIKLFIFFYFKKIKKASKVIKKISKKKKKVRKSLRLKGNFIYLNR